MTTGVLAVVLAVSGLMLNAAGSHGQQLRPGDHIRIHIDAGTRTGVFAGIADQRLEYQDRLNRSSSVSIDSIRRLSVGQQRERSRGALRSGMWAGVAAGAVGFVIGATNPDSDSGPLISEHVDSGLMAAVVLMVPGALIGSVVGLAFPGTHWQAVDIDALTVGPDRYGRPGASLRLETGRRRLKPKHPSHATSQLPPACL